MHSIYKMNFILFYFIWGERAGGGGGGGGGIWDGSEGT